MLLIGIRFPNNYSLLPRHLPLFTPCRKAMSVGFWLSYLIRSLTAFPGLVQAELQKALADCHCSLCARLSSGILDKPVTLISKPRIFQLVMRHRGECVFVCVCMWNLDKGWGISWPSISGVFSYNPSKPRKGRHWHRNVANEECERLVYLFVSSFLHM